VASDLLPVNRSAISQSALFTNHGSRVTNHITYTSGAIPVREEKRPAPAAGLLLALRGADNQIFDGVGRSGVPAFGLKARREQLPPSRRQCRQGTLALGGSGQGLSSLSGPDTTSDNGRRICVPCVAPQEIQSVGAPTPRIAASGPWGSDGSPL